MLVKILRNVFAGGTALTAGQVVDLPDGTARLLVGMQKAAPAPAGAGAAQRETAHVRRPGPGREVAPGSEVKP